MDALKKAALGAYLSRRLEQDKAQLAAGNGRVYNPHSVVTASNSVVPARTRSSGQTGIGRALEHAAAIRAMAGNSQPGLPGMTNANAQAEVASIMAKTPTPSGMPRFSANDYRQNVGTVQLDNFARSQYENAITQLNQNSGADLYRLNDEKNQLNRNLNDVQANIARMDEFYKQNGMYEDQLAYDSQIAARDSLQQRIAGVDSELTGLQDRYKRVEQQRPENVSPKGLDQYLDTYGQYSKGYPGNTGWNKENPYDAGLASPETAGMTRSSMQRDVWTLPQQMQDLQGMITQFEQAGMGKSKEVKNMRRQLEDLQERYTMLGNTALRGTDDFRSVVDDAKANGYKPGTKYADILEAVTNPEEYHDKNWWKTVLPFSPEYNTVFTAKYMTDDERDTFIYKWQEQGEEAANEYFESLHAAGNQRRTDHLTDAASNIASQSPIGAGAMMGVNALATPAKVFGLVESGVNAIKGEETDPYGQMFIGGHVGNAGRSAARDTLVNSLKKDGKDTVASQLAGFGFDAITTTVDNFVQALAYGPLAPVVMALGSASDTTADSLIRNGGESMQALLNGLAAGAAEYMTEKIPMDQLGEMLKGNSKGWRAVLMQGATEAPGEMLSTIFSEASDQQIMQAYSNYESRIAALMASDPNMTPAEAERIATREFWTEVGYSGALGWFSGDASAILAQAVGSGRSGQQAPEAGAGMPVDAPADTLIGLETAPEAETGLTGNCQWMPLWIR